MKSTTCLALLLITGVAEAATGPSDRIYWANVSGSITSALPDGSDRTEFPVSVGRGLWDIAVDSEDNRLYWFEDDVAPGNDDTATSIRRAYLDGTGAETIHQTERSVIIAITIDSLNGKIYWVTGRQQTSDWNDVVRSNLDGTNVEVLFDGNGFSNRMLNIAVDPIHEKLYWTDLAQQTIYQSNLDGSMRVPLLELEPDHPGPIALDLINDHLYWTAAGQINRSNLDGSSIASVIPIDGGIDDLAVDPVAEKIYWIDRDTNNMFDNVATRRANFDGTMIETLLSGEFFTRNLALHFPIVPEPASHLLLIIGISAGMFGSRRRSKRGEICRIGMHGNERASRFFRGTTPGESKREHWFSADLH